jgi:hypothetical protein
MQPLPPSEQLVDALIRAEFQEDIDIVEVLEEVEELHDVEVLHGPVDLDLGHQLLLGPAFLKRLLLHHLACQDLAVALSGELINFSEASLAEELALLVPDQLLGAIREDLLLYDGLGRFLCVHVSILKFNLTAFELLMND